MGDDLHRTRALLLAAGMFGIAGLTACEPAPEPTEIVVTTTATGAADGPVDIDVPTGTYRHASTTVHGDVRINPSMRRNVRIRATTLTVAEGATLGLTRIDAAPSHGSDVSPEMGYLRLDVAGRAMVLRSALGGLEIPCGSAPAAGDTSGTAEVLATVQYFSPGSGWVETSHWVTFPASSPLVDAVPLGDERCEATATDLYGVALGIDGDGDGTGGCDVGAVEHQP